jgi:acetyl esterase/lipase
MGIKKYFVNKMLQGWEKRDHKILAAQALPGGIKEAADIPYIADGQRGHLLDVYYPEDAREKLPVLIDIHGGGLVYGYKDMNRLYGYHLAKRGFIVFNANYRLAIDGAKVPEQIRDVAAAVNWISGNLDSYPADRKRIFITGESGGGILAVMAALIAKCERLRKLFGTEEIRAGVKAAAVVCGMMNLEEPSVGYWGIRSMCLERGYKKQEYYRNLIFSEIPEMKDLPPVYLTTGDEDELRHMTLNFEKTLQKYGVEYRMKYFNKKDGRKLGHMFSILHPEYEESAALIGDMLGFFLSKI